MAGEGGDDKNRADECEEESDGGAQVVHESLKQRLHLKLPPQQ